MIVIEGDRGTKDCRRGFSLVEIIVVISIIAILSSMIVPTLTNYTEKAKKEVCNANLLQLERMYEVHLIKENILKSEASFSDYLYRYGERICPDGGIVGYFDDKIRCSIHFNEDDEKVDEVDEDVPYL